jgi:hypothetical protein
MGIFRDSKKKVPPPTTNETFDDPSASIKQSAAVTKQGEQVIASSNKGKFRPSDVCDPSLHDPKSAGYKHKRTSTVPTAKESAFSGPPRYDWIDVESAATIKVQSVFRRNQVLDQLKKEGKSTAAMRNTIRMREAKKKGKVMASEDTPTFLRFCGIGMLFGDATGDDIDTLNSDKETGLKKFEQKEAKEMKKRMFRMRKKKEDVVEEAIEVVDNIDLEGEEEPVKEKAEKSKFRFRKSKK